MKAVLPSRWLKLSAGAGLRAWAVGRRPSAGVYALAAVSVELIIVVGVLVVLGGMLQSAVGFGFSVVTVPVMVLAGVDLPAAVAIALAATMGQVAWACWRNHAAMHWPSYWPMFFIRVSTMPLGVLALAWLTAAGQGLIKQVLGGILLTVLAAHWLLRVQPRQQVAPAWGVLAGTTSGFLGGLVGMGGPPLVLWVMAHDWPSRQARVFLWYSFLPMLPLALAMLCWKFGQPVVHATALGLMLMPLAVVGTVLGLLMGARMSRRRLRAATLALLVVVALVAVLEPMLLGP